MSIFDNLFGGQFNSGMTNWELIQQDQLMQQNYQSLKEMENHMRATLPGPSKYELEKYDSVRYAWEAVMDEYKKYQEISKLAINTNKGQSI